MQDRYLKDLKGPPAAKSRLQPLTEHTKVLIQSQTGKAPLRWDKTGVVVEVLPFDQYIVKVHGSGRLTRRNRKLLRAYVPAFEEEELRFPYSQDTDVDRGVDSAWGARDHMNQSADSNAGQGGGPIDSGSGTQDTTSPDDQDDSHGADLESSLGERDRGIDQSDTPKNLANVDLRRSTRAGKGKTSRFKDYAT